MILQENIPAQKSPPDLSRRRSLETGFPSPATDHMENRLDLHEHLVQNQPATFFCRIRGEDEEGLGLYDGDLLIVDRSLAYKHHSMVIAVIDGELRACRLWNKGKRWSLQFGDDTFIHLQRDGSSQEQLWGVVSYVVHSCI